VTEPDPSQDAAREGGAHPRHIRVAHVGNFVRSSASGVDRTIAGLVTHLGRLGIEPEVWHLSPDHGSVSTRSTESVNVIQLPAYHRAKSAAVGLPEETVRFVRGRRDEIDLLHLHSVFIPDNVRLAKVAGLPYVLTPNGGYSPQVLRGRNRLAKAVWMRVRERSYVRDADLIHAVAPDELDQLRSLFGNEAMVFAPNAIEMPGDLPGSRETELPPLRTIVFLGRLAVGHKGLDLLLEGYARFVREHSGAESELIIAGPDHRSGRSTLEAMATTLLPAGKVSFPGPVFSPEKEALLRSASVFVHTSRWEGMPFAVLEALAVGCPVLVTRATNLAEFVEESGAGVVVEGTPEGVEAGLRAILEAPPQRYTAMAAAAGRLASERFTWPAVTEQIAAAYRRLLG
jgi:glycosyltransferase involved in cell wall biosynthesis